MAKQAGSILLNGKLEGKSFYYTKNGGYAMRTINPGMSTRVKTAKEYANTRLNNAEFGAAGACAGAMVRGITSRWRFILDSIATGKLVARCKEAMMQDATSPWGQREIPVAQMPAVQELFNSLSKNQFPSELKADFSAKVSYDDVNKEYGQNGSITIPVEYINELVSKGANELQFTVYAYTSSNTNYSAVANRYLPCTALIEEISQDSQDISVGSQITFPTLEGTEGQLKPANTESNFGGLLVVMLPKKSIGGTGYTLQELCSAAWFEVPVGQA